MSLKRRLHALAAWLASIANSNWESFRGLPSICAFLNLAGRKPPEQPAVSMTWARGPALCSSRAIKNELRGEDERTFCASHRRKQVMCQCSTSILHPDRNSSFRAFSSLQSQPHLGALALRRPRLFRARLALFVTQAAASCVCMCVSNQAVLVSNRSI